MEAARLMDEAQTPSLFSQNRVLMVGNAEKVSKRRGEDLAALQALPNVFFEGHTCLCFRRRHSRAG